MLVDSRFVELGASQVAEIVAICDESSHAIEQDVKGGPNAAPFLTGNLRRSYHVEEVAGHALGPYFEAGNDPGIAPYAVHVEFGTVHARAQSHIRPATRAEEPRFYMKIAAVPYKGSAKGMFRTIPKGG